MEPETVCPPKDYYIGCNRDLDSMRSSQDRLSFRVLDQVNDTQEMVMVNDFARETNEFTFKVKVQERIAEINSWRWVLEDLTKRLADATATLKYEHKALRVVIERVKSEINEFSRDKTRPGALAPEMDRVEDAIQQENEFLRQQKKTFEDLIIELERHTSSLINTRKRIENDILKKIEAATIDETCANIGLESVENVKIRGKKRKKPCPLTRWENRCAALKRAGLNALETALIARQQARGARVQLSIAAQTYSSRVDVALRKRLHHNSFKLSELQWQRDEALKDFESLNQEQTSTEKSLIKNMEYEKLFEARLADRSLKPRGEHTKDSVDRKLREELMRLRSFLKCLRDNLKRIDKLKNNLHANVDRIECCAQDLIQVIRLDQERLSARTGADISTSTSTIPISTSSTSTVSRSPSSSIVEQRHNVTACLMTIREEEDGNGDGNDCDIDDIPYPFNF